MTRNPIPYSTQFSPSAVTLRDKHMLDGAQMHRNKNKNVSPVTQNVYQYIFEQKDSDSQFLKYIKYSEQEVSTMKSSFVSIKRPKEYCPLSKKKQPVKNQNIDKELHYLKSPQYRQYLQAVMEGTKNTQDVVRLMKQNRNNDVYLPKNQDSNQNKSCLAKRPGEPTDHCKKAKKQGFLFGQNHALVNLSPIHQRKDDFKMDHQTRHKNSQIHCEPYLQDSTIVEQSVPQSTLLKDSSLQKANRSLLKRFELCTSSLSSLPTECEYLAKSQKQWAINHVHNQNNYKYRDKHHDRIEKSSQKTVSNSKMNELLISQQQCKSQKYSHHFDSKCRYNEQNNCVNLLNPIADLSKDTTNNIYAIDFKLSQPTQRSAHIIVSNEQRQRKTNKVHTRQGRNHSGSNSVCKRVSVISLSKQAKANHA